MYLDALCVDGRDAWGGVSRNSNNNSIQPRPSAQTPSNDQVSSSAWNGVVSIVNTPDHDMICCLAIITVIKRTMIHIAQHQSASHKNSHKASFISGST